MADSGSVVGAMPVMDVLSGVLPVIVRRQKGTGVWTVQLQAWDLSAHRRHPDR